MNPIRTLAIAALTAALLVAGTAAAAEPSNKWRLAVDGRADADGSIVVRLTPKDGVGTEVKQLKSSVGKQYHVERDDFEDVLVKKKSGQADFAFELVSSSLPGVNLKFERE